MINNEFKIPQMATIDETAKMFGLAKNFVRQLAINGKIKCVNAGKKYLINIDKFVEYLNDCPKDNESAGDINE